jgi:hypothetical protein
LLAVSGTYCFAPFPGEPLKFFYVPFVDTDGFGYLDHENILSTNAAFAITIFSVLRSALPRPKVCGLRPPVGVKSRQGHDPSYNPYVEFAPTTAQLESGFDAKIQFTATRYEHMVDWSSVKSVSARVSISALKT